MLNFCTLFDINFLTQGLVMYESLRETYEDFHLYIFAFCDESYKILTQLRLENSTIISLNEFEDEELLKVKPTRTAGEYCWTCSSSTILYCLQKYKLDYCTYIDADLYFYSNPKPLLEEISDNSILLTEHRYTPALDKTETSGKYCVQFITFKNDERGLKALNWWRNSCLDWCYARFEDGKFGDQKYLDDWTERFEGVHVLKNLGGGVAPWNIGQYKITKTDNKLYLSELCDKKMVEFVFYHFHSIKILSNGKIDISRYNMYNTSLKNRRLIYKPYLEKIANMSKKLNKINKNIKIVKKELLDFKSDLLKFRRWIITVNFTKEKRRLSIFGFGIITPKK